MQVLLSVIKGPHQGKTFEFSEHDTFVVGRAKYAHFRLPDKDPYFSRAHFIVEVNPPFCRLIDLNSSNGTFVNGRRATEVDLASGDKILGGDTVIQVQIVDPTPSTAAQSGDEAQPRVTVREAVPQVDKVRVTQKELPAEISNHGRRIRDAATEPPNRFPRMLAHYKLIKEIGRGGMGIVFLAQPENSDRKVAVKTIVPGGAVSQRDLQQFLREASILRQLVHPNVVAFLDAGEVNGTVFLAMEFVHGHNAQQILKLRGPLSPKVAVAIVSQLLMALDYAHAKGFVHRDIKPANLLIRKDQQGLTVKLSDFGLARVFQASKLSGLTLHGEMGGSVGFMAPEQITNYRDASPLADLYATAATLYHLLTGKLVYDFPEKLADRVLMILQKEPVPIAQRRSDVSAGLANVIHKALSRNPQKRYANARQLHDALHESL